MLATQVKITARYYLRGKSPTILLGFTPSTRNCALVKTIPGWEYDPKVKQWYIPFTHAAVRNLLERFPGVQVDRSIAQLIRDYEAMDNAIVHRRDSTLDDPEITKTPCWVHQKWSYNFSRYLPYVLLAIDMGGGKSKVLIDLFVNQGFRRGLIICPKGVMDVWPAEFKRHCAIDVQVGHLDYFLNMNCNRTTASLTQKTEYAYMTWQDAIQQNTPCVLIINYDSVWREPFASFILNEYKPDMIACDEAHRLAGVSSKISLFAAELGKTNAWKAALTGTPMTQHPGTVYGIARFLDVGIFGPWWRFKADYAIMGGFEGRQIVAWKNTIDLERRLDRIMFRVKSEEVQDLPELVEVYRTCTLSAEAAKIYRSMYDWSIAHLPDDQVATAKIVLVKMLRLHQLTGGWLTPDSDDPESPTKPVRVDTSKQELLKEILEDLDVTEPVVIFCKFTADIDTVRECAAATGRMCFEFSGRRKDLQAWKRGDAPILAVQIQSGSEGIDLTRARYSIYYSNTFSLAQYRQSLKRLHRPGQKSTVTAIHLVAELPNGRNTIDHALYKSLSEKREVIDSVLELIGR